MGMLDSIRTRRAERRKLEPAAIPGSTIMQGAGQWGDISLPLPASATVMGLPAANRAVQLIANALATMSPMQQLDADGFVLPEEETAPVLLRPNAAYGCFDFFYMATELAVMRGNFLGLWGMDRGAEGLPNQIIPVPVGSWFAYIDGAGHTVYSVAGIPRLFARDEVVHVRANAQPNSPMGIGVVERFRRALGHALDQQNFAADTYRSGSVPAGVINLDRPEIDEAQATLVQTQWITNHAGGRAPAVLPNTMTYEPVQWTPEDMQFLESRQFTVGEIALMFNLDPTDLGASLSSSSSMTYANIEQRQTARITDTYGPWMRRFEEEWSDLVPGTAKAQLVPARLLRTDTKTRAEVDEIEIRSGTRSKDEARARDGLHPLPKDETPEPEPGNVKETITAAGAPEPGAPVAPPEGDKPAPPPFPKPDTGKE